MLKEKLNQDLKESLKSGNSQKRMVLGMVLSAVKNREFEKRSKLSKTETDISKLEEQSKLNDEEIIETLSSEIKKRKETNRQERKECRYYGPSLERIKKEAGEIRKIR